jgi:glycosyltransferase involved in cell wall biosynthesis
MREYYDRWDAFSAGLSPEGRLKESVRRSLIHAADRYLLRSHVTKVVAQSQTVRARLEKWIHLRADVVYPPPPPRPYRTEVYGDYLFVASRLSSLKRIDLTLRALAQRESEAVRCVIGGEGEERLRLEALARDLGIADRVTFAGRLSEAALLDHLARCRAVVFTPLDEDFGFVTVEAFASAKAVVTTSDSGGPAELVRDGVNGFVTAPDAVALARAIGRVASDRELAERLGRQGLRDVAPLTWPETVRKLLLV